MFDREAVDNKLDVKGFTLLFRVMGQVISSAEAEDVFRKVDSHGQNAISFGDFFKLYSEHACEEKDRKDNMMEAVEKVFPGKTGDPVELKKVESLLKKLQSSSLGDDVDLAREKTNIGADDIQSLVKEMDGDGSGFISREALVDTLCQRLNMSM